MTTLATEGGGASEVINARRTESLDAPHILDLVQPWTETLFGRFNVVNIIEKAVLAVTLTNESEDIMAHAAFFDYPNMTDCDPAKWESWMGNLYSSSQCNSLNSLFMHYFVAHKDYAQGCAREIVRTAFNAVPDLHFIFLVVPVGVVPDASIASVFNPMNKPESSKGPRKAAIFVCHRHSHVPVLHIRKARVEDHDDLTPIFNRQSDMLKATYGDFFLAELIEAQDDHMHCLVAEVDGTAIGFMSISDDVNLNLMNECFELGPSHGLRKPHPDDVTSPEPMPVPSPTQPKASKDEVDIDKASVTSQCSKDEVTEVTAGDESGKEAVAPEVEEQPGAKPPKGEGAVSRASSRSGSVGGESKVVPKLSDAQMGDSTHSLLSDSTDQELQMDRPPSTENKLSRPPSSSTPKPLEPPPLSKRFVPTYNGGPNAFSIQLFCIDERYEMRSCDFMPKAFSLFTDYDFCVVTVPHLVPEFPLIQNFVRITPRCPSTLPQELYAFHRSGLLKNFVVRPACSGDFAAVQNLVKNILLNENLLQDLTQYNKARRDTDGTEIQAYIAECQKQIVGVAIIRREEDIEYIRSHYNIEDFIYFNHHRREDHAHLHHLALNPIFSHLTKHFIKEILRLSNKTCLYYPLYPIYSSKETVLRHSLVCSLGTMVPVRARRQIKYPVEQLGINAPSDRILVEREAYALNHINRKLTLEPKVTINARIVVVGASDVGLSFLETFAYCPHLRFNNLTLISPHGLPGEMLPDAQRDQMLPTSHCYSQQDYAKVSLRTWVNVVYGHMTAIERKKKFVVVDGAYQVPYDHLVLCTGQQFQVPAPTGADIDTGVTNENLPGNPNHRLLVEPPKNLYLVNDMYDAAVGLYRAENTLLKNQKPIVVYGSNINAYCCVQSLLTLGIAGNKIALVQPPAEEACFEDNQVMEAVKTALQEAGVQVHSGYYLARWNDQVEIPEEITCATFTSASEPLRLECQAFFSFFKKAVDMNAFKAINDSYLVYDGKLVIDASFHTNDVTIRGAGPLTKFKRRYHADQWTHACFNSKEVGIALAAEMLRLFDPTLEAQPAPPEETLNLIPIYRSPRILGALLPGGYHYLEVKKPGIPDPPEQQMAQNLPSREIYTGEAGSGDGYMKIGVSQYQAVDTVVCLSKKAVPTSNLICLYGVHQRTLNNMLSRYDEGLIRNLYSYFKEAWCTAVFHDRFADFRDEIRELLVTSPRDAKETLEEKVRKVVDEEVGMSDSQREQLLEAYKSTGSKRAVETRLLSFLAYNYYHLPMYAKPGMV
ncbi:cilia- and flagella-associated protein 61-like [Littorina saxatilis]|uniref:Cilia- and flagella-associated protein 61 N-terminal domain-containing protein n=1 Tax=Littorina saxatilis TaxID=31220 RepID=A0AAN9GCL8_9CAEN